MTISRRYLVVHRLLDNGPKNNIHEDTNFINPTVFFSRVKYRKIKSIHRCYSPHGKIFSEKPLYTAVTSDMTRFFLENRGSSKNNAFSFVFFNRLSDEPRFGHWKSRFVVDGKINDELNVVFSQSLRR